LAIISLFIDESWILGNLNSCREVTEDHSLLWQEIIIIKIIIISNPDKDVASFYGNPVLSTF